jgi:DNA-binding PadR family transcriptional regulator
MTENEGEITYNAVEKNGTITTIWEMRGRKHIRTIDPRSEEGRRLLASYKPAEATTEKSQSDSAHS